MSLLSFSYTTAKKEKGHLNVNKSKVPLYKSESATLRGEKCHFLMKNLMCFFTIEWSFHHA